MLSLRSRSWTQSYTTWYETWPQEGIQGSFPTWCINNVYSENWDPDCHFLEDNHTGKSFDLCEQWQEDVHSAEYIAEAPCRNSSSPCNSYYTLADFGYVVMTNTQNVQNGQSMGGDAETHDGFWMNTGAPNGNGTACAYPGAWNNQAFTITWENGCY